MAFDRKKMSILYQTGFTVIICYTCFIMGLIYAWPSSTVKIFSSANTTLHRPMYEMEIALFGSLSSIAALISTPLSGLLLDTLGRKYSCILTSITQVVSWAIVVVSNLVEAILVATFISGIGGNCYLIVPVFISEFCQDSIRGMMTTGSSIAINFGMLISYLFDGCLEYNTMIYTCLLLSVAGVVMLLPLKESPLFLMKKGLEKDAAKAIAFYRHEKVDSKQVIQEMNKIRMALNLDLEDLTPEVEKPNQDADSQENPSSKWEVLSLTAEEEILYLDAKSQKKTSKWAFFRDDRPDRPGGGTAIYYKKSLHCSRIPTPQLTNMEATIKSLMSMISIDWVWICNFMVLFIFNPLVSTIGLGPVFYIFAGICFGTAAFSYFLCLRRRD